MVATNQNPLSASENSLIRLESRLEPAATKTTLLAQAQVSSSAVDRQVAPQQKTAPRPLVDQERAVLQLPSDYLKTPTTPYQPKYWTLTLPDRLVQSLRLQAQQKGVNERSFLLAAFNVLLYRYTQQETIDLALTVPTDTSVRKTELCTQICSELTVRALIHQIAASLQNIQDQATALTPQAQLERSLNQRAPLPVAVTFIEAFFRVEGKEPLALSLETSDVDRPDLHLMILQQPQALSALLKYNANLFRPETVQRLTGHWQTLLEGMVSDWDGAIAQLPLLTEAEAHQLLLDWQSPSVDYPPVPVHHSIEVHAAQQPDAIAVTFKDRHLTYAELNQRANQLAHYLIQLGIGAEVPVAVCVEPSLDVAVSLLGIFKAGGVYVPLDPTYPAERLTTILQETQPKVLLTQSHLVSLPTLTDHILYLDQDWDAVRHYPTHTPAIELSLQQTSHLIYTSGTTGKPKGIATSYGNLVQCLLVAQERFGFDRSDVMPAIARFTFSITMFELLSPLVAGGTLVILEREHVLDFKRLTQTLTQLTVIHASPSLLQKLLAYIQEQDLDLQVFHGLKHISTGGDMVPAALLDTMKRVFQKAEIYVIYGCSEVSCMGCTYPVARHLVTQSRVGKPFPNVSVRLYDSHQNLVPIGIPGEIYIGGAGVTKGYLHREALTQEKFVTIEGRRFYRTGDMGRFDADGNLEMLGRTDFQIKLRGMRLELGEIETVLRQAPGVREGIVMAREVGSEKRLVAYVVLDQAHTPAIGNIRSLLQEKLPDYMVPTAFVVLEAMPVNMNQKVDRRALPLPTPENMAGFKAFLAPRDEWERQLTVIWEAVLGMQPIGIQNDFFELGGDSLKAVQILTQIEKQFGKRLPITAPLQAPTIEALAKLLHSDEDEENGSDLVVLRRGGTKPPLFCLYGVLLYRALADHLDADQPVYGVYLQEEVELLKTGNVEQHKALFSSVPRIATRYLQSIRTLQPHGPYYLAGESFGGVVAFEMAKQLQAAGETIALVALLDSLAPHTNVQKPLAQKLKLHWQLLSQQGLAYPIQRVQSQMQLFITKLQAMRQRASAAKNALQTLDDIAQADIRGEMRQRASDSYFPSPYTGEVVLFRAMEQDPFETYDRDMGWTPFAAGGLQIFDVPGDHLGILKDPSVRVLAEQLETYLPCLDRIQA